MLFESKSEAVLFSVELHMIDELVEMIPNEGNTYLPVYIPMLSVKMIKTLSLEFQGKLLYFDICYFYTQIE